MAIFFILLSKDHPKIRLLQAQIKQISLSKIGFYSYFQILVPNYFRINLNQRKIKEKLALKQSIKREHF